MIALRIDIYFRHKAHICDVVLMAREAEDV